MRNPRESLVAAAKTQIGVRETSRNAAPEILKYWEATTYPDGMKDRQPWCAAFLAWVVFTAMLREPLLAVADKTRPRSAAVADWIRWAAVPSNGAAMFGPRDPVMKPMPGDIVIFTFSHIGVVEKPADGGVFTIEGNTDDAGSREGWKVCRRRRSLSVCRTFIRLAARAVKAAAGDGRLKMGGRNG